MDRLIILDRDNWCEFLAAPYAVLMLGKSNCDACAEWTEQLQGFLETDQQWQHVAFGKLELDRPGLGSFKKANTWLSEVDDLPFTILYSAGDRKKDFVGSGIERLVNRMNRVFVPLTENGTT